MYVACPQHYANNFQMGHNVNKGAAKTKGGKRAKKGGQVSDGSDDDSDDPKAAAQRKLSEATQAIQKGMFCAQHNRLCFQTHDGKCGAYTPQYVLEHATMLVSRPYPFLWFDDNDFPGAR